MATRVMGLLLSACLAAGFVWGQEQDTPREVPKPLVAKPKPLQVRVIPRPVQAQPLPLAAPTPKLVVRKKPAVEDREREVFRLRYVPAEDVANTLQAVIVDDRSLSAEYVAIVPEPVGNSLVVSAAPDKMKVISKMIDELDEAPAMVALEVAIAEIKLHDAPPGKDNPLGFDEPTSKDKPPGFGTPAEKDKPAKKPAEGNDRLKARLKAAGLDLDATAEDLAKQIAVLEERGRLELLNRAILTTLDNQPAFLQVGERKPRVTGSTASAGFSRGGTPSRTPVRRFSVSYENVGLIVSVTPRINPDGVVTMEIDVEKAWLASDAEGPAVAESDSGEPVRAPRVRTTTAKSTVSAADGKTIVLGGLTAKSKTEAEQFVILVTPRILHGGR